MTWQLHNRWDSPGKLGISLQFGTTPNTQSSKGPAVCTSSSSEPDDPHGTCGDWELAFDLDALDADAPDPVLVALELCDAAGSFFGGVGGVWGSCECSLISLSWSSIAICHMGLILRWDWCREGRAGIRMSLEDSDS